MECIEKHQHFSDYLTGKNETLETLPISSCHALSIELDPYSVQHNKEHEYVRQSCQLWFIIPRRVPSGRVCITRGNEQDKRHNCLSWRQLAVVEFARAWWSNSFRSNSKQLSFADHSVVTARSLYGTYMVRRLSCVVKMLEFPCVNARRYIPCPIFTQYSVLPSPPPPSS
jgi:hypothetical protein